MEQQIITACVERVKTERNETVVIKEEIDIDWDERDNFCETKSDNMIKDSNFMKIKKTVIKKSLVRRNNKNMAVPKSLDCNICRKHFATNATLRSHNARCGKEPKFHCGHCSFKSKFKSGLKEHIFRKHMEPVASDKIESFKIGNELYFHCPKCNKKQKTKNYVGHTFYCNKKPQLQCAHCPFKTKWKFSLSIHVHGKHAKGSGIPSTEINSDGITRYCQNCDRAQEHHRSVKDCQKCFSKLLFQCSKCKKVIDKRQPARHHWMSRCGLSGYFHCHSCDYKSVRRSAVVHHSKMVHPGLKTNGEIRWKSLLSGDQVSSLYQCPNCSKRMNSAQTLKMHMKVCQCVENENKNSMGVEISDLTRCSKCQKKFEHVYLLNSHLKFCSKNNYVTRVTRDCDDEIIEVVEGLILDHAPVTLISIDEIRKDIEEMAVRRCDKCGQESPIKDNYKSTKQHVQCQKCQVRMRFKCKKCQKEFFSKKSITSHVKFVCYPKEEFKCTKCDFKDVNPNKVREHYKYVHDTVSADCNVCGKKFRNIKTLKIHQWKCGVEPKFQCGHCPFKTKYKDCLREHIFRIHMETKVIDRAQSYKIACQRFARTLIPLKACCLCCKKEQRLYDRMKICIKCKNKLHFKCKTCKKKCTADDKNACEHVKAYLEMIKYECQRCGRGALTKKSMSTHKSRCGRSIPCRFCKYTSNDRGTIKKHEERKHPNRV